MWWILSNQNIKPEKYLTYVGSIAHFIKPYQDQVYLLYIGKVLWNRLYLNFNSLNE